MKGTEITVHVPYVGEMVFFDVRPSTFTLSPPRADVDKGEIRLVYSFPNDMPPPNLKAEMGRNLNEIKSYLRNLEGSASVFSDELPSLVRSHWEQRKKQFAKKRTVTAGLGIPMRTKPLVTAPPTAAAFLVNSKDMAATAAARQQRDWKVFISHASEDKQGIAKPLADALIAKGLAVWYDTYTLTVGDSLRQKINEGLANSEYGIVILSKAFFGKHWPEQELNGLAAREVAGKKVILPVWYDVSRDEIAAASPILADRLGVPSSLGIDQVVDELLRAMG